MAGRKTNTRTTSAASAASATKTSATKTSAVEPTRTSAKKVSKTTTKTTKAPTEAPKSKKGTAQKQQVPKDDSEASIEDGNSEPLDDESSSSEDKKKKNKSKKKSSDDKKKKKKSKPSNDDDDENENENEIDDDDDEKNYDISSKNTKSKCKDKEKENPKKSKISSKTHSNLDENLELNDIAPNVPSDEMEQPSDKSFSVSNKDRVAIVASSGLATPVSSKLPRNSSYASQDTPTAPLKTKKRSEIVHDPPVRMNLDDNNSNINNQVDAPESAPVSVENVMNEAFDSFAKSIPEFETCLEQVVATSMLDRSDAKRVRNTIVSDPAMVTFCKFYGEYIKTTVPVPPILSNQDILIAAQESKSRKRKRDDEAADTAAASDSGTGQHTSKKRVAMNGSATSISNADGGATRVASQLGMNPSTSDGDDDVDGDGADQSAENGKKKRGRRPLAMSETSDSVQVLNQFLQANPIPICLHSKNKTGVVVYAVVYKVAVTTLKSGNVVLLPFCYLPDHGNVGRVCFLREVYQAYSSHPETMDKFPKEGAKQWRLLWRVLTSPPGTHVAISAIFNKSDHQFLKNHLDLKSIQAVGTISAFTLYKNDPVRTEALTRVFNMSDQSTSDVNVMLAQWEETLEQSIEQSVEPSDANPLADSNISAEHTSQDPQDSSMAQSMDE